MSYSRASPYLRVAEEIKMQPHVCTRFRDVSLHYDVTEAYTLSKDKNCLSGYFYSFSEEIPFQDNVLSQRGNANMLKAIFVVSPRVPSFGFTRADSLFF